MPVGVLREGGSKAGAERNWGQAGLDNANALFRPFAQAEKKVKLMTQMLK